MLAPAPEVTVEELLTDPAGHIPAFQWTPAFLSWRNVFLALDRTLKVYDRLPWKPFRRQAVRLAARWLVEHLEHSDGLCAIYPAMMNAVFALMALGHHPDDPLTRREIGQLARFEIEEDDTLRLQPCLSPVWDTAITVTSLHEAGIPAKHPALARAARWLLDLQVMRKGDWRTNPPTDGGGWAFEFRNDFYPNVDDTAFVLMALRRAANPKSASDKEGLRRGLEWMLGMQNSDGGWGAFDRDNDSKFLCRIPFADHNAMIDPSTADLTARALECLGKYGWSASHPRIKRAVEFIQRDQTTEGAWYGRWGANYIYGTSGVLRAMDALGLQNEPYCQRAAAWLRSTQNPDGGWGETCASYDDPSQKGKGVSTASQTAWGLVGLLAAGDLDDPAVTRAVRYLVSRQLPDGSWAEEAFTGTGFPSVFYLKYHLYRNSFPLYALAHYLRLLEGKGRLHSKSSGRNGDRRTV